MSVNPADARSSRDIHRARSIFLLPGCRRHKTAYVGRMSAAPQHQGLRAIALFEAGKGALVLLAGFGLLSLLGRNAAVLAEQLVSRLHLNPAHHYPQVFIHAMAELTNTRLWLMAAFAALYATVRFVEAYGLWRGRRWAEWLAALSAGVYVPVEIYELAQGASWLKIGALAANLAVMGYMVWLLAESRRPHKDPEQNPT